MQTFIPSKEWRESLPNVQPDASSYERNAKQILNVQVFCSLSILLITITNPNDSFRRNSASHNPRTLKLSPHCKHQ